MKSRPATDPATRAAAGNVALLIEPRQRDLGGFTVRRVLPSGRRRMVGPFIFFDHMGPATFPPGKGIAVRPHPHIGLATVTYLFDGEIIHRDSLGYRQPIRRGAVNLMTAGRGIVHSERAGDDLHTESTLHGIQSWMALPDADEECEPAFAHYPAAAMPTRELEGVSVRLIIGSAFDMTSPVEVRTPMLYLELRAPAGSSIRLPDGVAELAVYVVDGQVDIGARRCAAGMMAVAAAGAGLTLRAATDSHVMVIGGEAVGERHIWWNFVSSSTARIEQAKNDWRAQRFGRIDGDEEFSPLPEK